jgi:alpha,alpha-trehalase
MATFPYQAVILDLDGVITQTARVHAIAWQRMFNEYLQQRSEREPASYPPFDPETDYRRYVDGKPRYDGVRSFLAARDIELPEGNPDDAPDQETICGLGNRKNQLFRKLLEQQGVEVYQDTVAQIHRWHDQGLKIAVVSSSRNCVPVLEAAGILELFDTKVDGVDSERLGLAGKPCPDIFLRAAQQLQVEPARAIAVEDAISGIQAAKAGHLGLVVGMAHEGSGEDLQHHGADCVVHRMDELHLEALPASSTASEIPSALAEFETLAQRLQNHTVALFTDYDGTLTPIVERPEDAVLSAAVRSLLSHIAQHCTVAIISGRDLADVQQLVDLEQLYYAGSHGFDIAGPALRQQQEEAQASLPELDAATLQLRDQVADLPGVRVERKKFAIAIHYRGASPEVAQQVQAIVDKVQADGSNLRLSQGKKIFELQPDVPWNKGYAILWLLEQLQLKEDMVVPLYLGDDTTDEDGFQALRDRGIGIRVGPAHEATQAAYTLSDPEAVQQFLQRLLSLLNSPSANYG